MLSQQHSTQVLRPVLILGVVALLVALGLSTFLLQRNTLTTEGLNLGSPSEPAILTGTTNVPLLPGTRLASSYQEGDLPRHGEYFFYVDDPGTVHEIAQFYKQHLESAGWSLVQEDKREDFDYRVYTIVSVGSRPSEQATRTRLTIGSQVTKENHRELYIWYRIYPELDVGR
jgi:hypothetical protein